MTPSITVCMFVLLTRLRWKKARGGTDWTATDVTIKMPSAKLVSVERRAADFISKAGTDRSSPVGEEATKKTVVNMRLDTDLLRRIEAAAKRQGITRTAWLSVAATRLLEE